MNRGCAVVVGAGTGTGAEVSKRFAIEGYSVALGRRDATALASLVAEIESAGGTALAFGVDAGDETQVVDLFERAENYVNDDLPYRLSGARGDPDNPSGGNCNNFIAGLCEAAGILLPEPGGLSWGFDGPLPENRFPLDGDEDEADLP